MSAIKSIFIPHFEKHYNANYLHDVFNNNKIAKINKIAIEKYNKNDPYNRYYKKAFIEIDTWYDTEIAYNFVKKLRNPYFETKLSHKHDKWWIVLVNQHLHKTSCPNKKRSITCFQENIYLEDEKIFDEYLDEIYKLICEEELNKKLDKEQYWSDF